MAKTEEFNLKEEIGEEISNILRRGINNERSAVFRILRKEQYSPKGMAMLLSNGIYNDIFYECNLDGIAGLDFSNVLQKARQILVLSGRELESNREMIKNLKKTGNVYGSRE